MSASSQPIVTKGLSASWRICAPLEYPGVTFSHAEIGQRAGSNRKRGSRPPVSVPGTSPKVIEAERQGADAVHHRLHGRSPAAARRAEVASISRARPRPRPACMSPPCSATNSRWWNGAAAVCAASSRTRRRSPALRQKLAPSAAVEIPVLELEDDLDRHPRHAGRGSGGSPSSGTAPKPSSSACTGLMGCAAAVRDGLLKRGINIPVIDPIPTAVSIARRWRGVQPPPQSKLPYPPAAAKSLLLGYDDIRLPTAIAAE